MIVIAVKAACFQMELGISADRPCFSRRPIQTTNPGTRTMLMVRKAMVTA